MHVEFDKVSCLLLHMASIFFLQRAANKKAPIADEELVSKKNDKKKLVVNDGKKRDNLKHPT